MADQAKGKGIVPKRASNPADLGQSSRPLLPIRTLLEDEEDGEDYSEVIEVLKQYIKSYKRVIASQSSNIKTLLLSLNTLKASVEDSVSAIKNISSTLASLTNSSNAATTGKTSYSPRFNPFSSTIDLDSPPRPPRKEPYLGPAIDNTATSNLDPPIDTRSKEGFKDTITSSIVKELSKKAYTILDDSKLSRESNFEQQYSRPIKSKKKDVYNEFHALTFSTYKKGLSAFNAEFNGYLAKLTMAKIDIDPSLILNHLNIEYLIANILEESRNPAIEAYRAAYIANSSNSTPNSNSNPSKKGKNKKKGKKKASYNIKGQNYSAKSAEQASFILGSYNLAIEEEEEEFDSSSNSRYKKRKDFKGKGLKPSSNNKAKYKDNKPRRRPRDPALYNSQLRPINTRNSPISPASIGSITLEVFSRKAPPIYTKLVLDNVLYLPNFNINIISRVRHYDSGGCLIKETLYRGDRRCIAVLDFKKSGFFLNVKGSSKPILHANFAFPLGLSSYTTKSIELQRNKIVVEIPSNSIRKEDYRPIIEDTIVSEAIKPNKRYKLRNSPAKGTTLEGTREPEPLTSTRDLPRVLRELVIEGNEVEKAISSPTLKEPNISQRDYYNLLNLAKLWHVRLGHIGLRLLKKTSSITKGLPNFDKIKEADFHCSSYDRGKAVRRVSKALIPNPPRVLDSIEGDTVKIRPRPYNRNPIVLLLVNRKNLDLDLEGAVSPDPSNLNTKKPISIEIGPSKLESYESSSNSKLDKPSPDKPINPVIVESTRPTISIRKPELTEAFPQTIEPIFTPKPIELDYYKLLAKTSSYILSFVYKARKRVISKDSTPTTYKQVLKLPRDEHSKWLEAITKEFIQLLELGVFKFLPRSLLPSNHKLITYRNVLKVKKDTKNRPIKYKSRIPPTWRILLAIGAVLDWEIEQADFIGAFLNSALREEIYMEIPKGLLDLAASNKAIYKLLLKYSYNPSTPNIIKLSKALYSLKQSPREWQDKLKILLKSLGYLPLISDPGVFYNAKTCYFIVTYIDNCLFIGPNIGYITDLKKRLNKVYAIEDLGPAAYFLGVQIIRDRPNRRLWLNQSQYIEEAVSRFNLANSKPISIPL
ncbi:hypothetical protein P8C59_003934 [Phyllachora maydis]|uniref:Reverse transcriptase Ty1/copia-type domain-containing protein n=1 Tax=Phyllachora maydis TaxID=1825666 RepID=A0AAD9MCX8_9PEZI|nr:hypothetical protein P8C59_003934 [Phyllachora maydis]